MCAPTPNRRDPLLRREALSKSFEVSFNSTTQERCVACPFYVACICGCACMCASPTPLPWNAHMEPLRENQTKITRLLVAQPRAPAGRRAHATNTRLSNIGFCGSPSCHVDFEPSAAIEKSSKILLISYDKNWAPPLHHIFYQEHGFRCRGVF